MKKNGSILISDYAKAIAETDILKASDITPYLQGLFGEVGGIMSSAKKHVRKDYKFPSFQKAAEEEFGDTLWYLAAICRYHEIALEEVFREAVTNESYEAVGTASDIEGAFSLTYLPLEHPSSLDDSLLKLGGSAAVLLGENQTKHDLVAFARAYMNAMQAAKLSLSEIVQNNLHKARGAFLPPRLEDLIDLNFDKDFRKEERLPETFRIKMSEKGPGKSYLQWNGVFIGDPLKDNIADEDGYRFHDVFHFAYAAILHWSPVIRALIKHKRKSSPKHDEEQDSGRAIVVEEGLSAWIFSRAKEFNYFENDDKIPLGMLKTIGEFVKGYEVEQCPLKLWEKAILDGFKVFRQLKKNKGGWIIGDRKKRTIKFEPLKSEL